MSSALGQALISTYETGYRNGESSLLADVNTLCDQLGIEVGDRHELTAIREEIERLRLEVEAAEIRRDMGL